MSSQRTVRAIEQNSSLPLDQQAQLRKFVLENGDPCHQFMHKSFPQPGALTAHLLTFVAQTFTSRGGSVFSSQSPAAVAECDFPESCSACCATTFISFSKEEKRCMIS